MLKLRKYQQQIITDSREAFKSGAKNIALTCSVGSGKSLIAKEILTLAKGKKCAFFSFRVLLIDQIKTYFNSLDGFDITFGTLQKHHKEDVHYDLIIKDELWSHGSKLTNSLKYNFMITLTGTPVDAKGYPLKFDKIVEGVQLPDLVELGYAKPIKVLATSKVDTSNLKKQGAEFNKKEAFELMDKPKIHKDIIGVYKKHCTDRKVLVFGVNIEHCENLKKEFLANNIKTETVHSKKDNSGILEDYKNNKIEVLINADMLTVGYDEPSINTIIIARPLASVPLLIQIVGRATRLNQNKKYDYALILDCSEAIKRCGHHPLQRLDFTKKREDKDTKCKACKTPVKLIDRKVTIIDKYEYCVTSKYRCDECNTEQIIENIKLFSLTICENCGEEFESKNGLQISQGDNSINFDIECAKCNHKRKFREILLSDEELKEVTLKEALENTETWEQVEIVLKAEVKKDGYKWQYSNRLLEHCKNKKFTPREVVEHIKRIRLNGKKVSMLMYI